MRTMCPDVWNKRIAMHLSTRFRVTLFFDENQRFCRKYDRVVGSRKCCLVDGIARGNNRGGFLLYHKHVVVGRSQREIGRHVRRTTCCNQCWSPMNRSFCIVFNVLTPPPKTPPTSSPPARSPRPSTTPIESPYVYD